MKNSFWCLILIYFLASDCEGIIAPCDHNNSEYNVYECVEFLERSVLELQHQTSLHSIQLANQFEQLQNQAFQLAHQFDQMQHQTFKLENHAAEMENQAVELENAWSELSSHATQLTTHTSQLSSQSSQITNHSTQLTSQSIQLATHATQLTNHTSQLSSQSTQLDTHSTQMTDHAELLQVLRNNSVPIGFIYVQLPSQSAPTVLWPMSTWQEVTSEYAGLFFRALGGGSESFESIQSDNSPRITEIQTTGWQDNLFSINVHPNGEWSEAVSTGNWLSNAEHSGGIYRLRFRQSQTEVRPRNTAMRIWRKIS